MKYSAPWYKESSLGPSPFHASEATSHNRGGLKDLMQHTELVWTLFLHWIRKCEMFKATAHYNLVPPLWREHSFPVTIVLLFCLQMKTVGYQEKFCLVQELVCQWSDRMLQLPPWMLYGALILFAWSQNLDSYNIVCGIAVKTMVQKISKECRQCPYVQHTMQKHKFTNLCRDRHPSKYFTL